MRFSPLSFILGAVAASLVPMISRVFRPLAVEATAAGLGMLEDARRVVAEQLETLEDVVAEARARREHLDDAAMAASGATAAEATTEEPAPAVRARRRSPNGSGARRRASAPAE